MRSIDYLTPFVEVSRILCDGAQNKCLMGLIAGKVAKTLDLKGCLIKMKGLQSDQMELLANCGLSEHFLLSKSDDVPDWVCSRLPGKTICVPSLQNDETTAERELMMIEGIQAFAVLPIKVAQETVAMAALFSKGPARIHQFGA